MTMTLKDTPNFPSETENRAVSPSLATLYTRIQLAVMGAFLALSTGAKADGIDLSPITGMVCSVATQLKAPALLGAAGMVIVLVFGWNKLMGESNAFQGLKNGVIGAMIILAAGTISTALFKGQCG